MTVKNANTIIIGLLFLAVSSSFNGVVCDSTKVVVDSPFGKIEGVKKTDKPTGESYVSFHGIPYAKPPVGPLRFHKPEPHPTLDGVFDATKENVTICPQPEGNRFGFSAEDCLTLNIRAKDTGHNGKALKKVLVFIHGGGFKNGFSNFYQSTSFVLSQDVIVVTINYRLGILGFLSTEDGASLGNYGLWDQILALKWVKDNIRAFGGDPEDITVTGESAGGISVGYLAVSSHAKGLFSKAYPQSGTGTSALGSSEGVQLSVLRLAKAAGCWDKEVTHKVKEADSRLIMQCLRQVPVSAFTSFDIVSTPTQFIPRVDNDFISDTPLNLLQDDTYLDSIGFYDRSYLAGFDNRESAFIKSSALIKKDAIFMNNKTSTKEKELMWKNVLRDLKTRSIMSRFEDSKNPINKTDTLIAVEEFYSRRFVDDLSIATLISSHLLFLIPTVDYVMAASRRERCSSYLFYFDHFPEFMKGSYRGIAHGVDLAYWFDMDLKIIGPYLNVGIEGGLAEDDLDLKTMFSTIIGDFMHSRNPGHSLKNFTNQDWPRFDEDNSFLNFNPSPWIDIFVEKDVQDFWLKTLPNRIKRNRPDKPDDVNSAIDSTYAIHFGVLLFFTLMFQYIVKT